MPPKDTIKELCAQALAVKDAARLNAILSQLREAVEDQSDRLDIMLALYCHRSQPAWARDNI